MRTQLKIAAIAAALAAGTSGAAMAQYSCPAGYIYYGGACQPVRAPAATYPAYPSGPVSGAVAGGAAGAAGGAVGTATGAVTGTANALTGGATATPTCSAGYVYYNGGCYPAGYGGTAAAGYAQGDSDSGGYNSPGTNTPGAPGSMAGGTNAVTNQTDTNTMGGHESVPGYPYPVEPGAGPPLQESASSQLPTGGPKPH